MTTTLNYIVTTGDFIAEWMDDEGINAAELARRLGTSRKYVSELLSGKAPLSHPMALSLEQVTSVPARIWNLYESGYRSELASRAAEGDLAAQYQQAKAFPLTFLRKFGYIKAPARDHVNTVRELLSLLGVASFSAFEKTWTEGSIAYRRSAAGRKDVPLLATWLALAERHHDSLGDVPDFDRDRVAEVVPTLRALTTAPGLEGIEGATHALFEAGVVVCFVPGVPGLRIHGATRWLNAHPVIQLSVLGKSDDQLWFTLLHEIGHVLLHGDKELYLNGEETEAEAEADRYAADTFIPPDFVARIPRGRNIGAIRSLADELGIAPGIVLGRAQRITKDYGWGHDLKRKYEFKQYEGGTER
ncbi:MAG: ImmA/IrrE family metallo-endopeptidase [Nocardioides sp.]|uniref:ImmA/IrrE family metallo-endopeptidase n=1 Tax=Nocardioides sp. TaxID=35761 RepID=UPI003D6C27AB